MSYQKLECEHGIPAHECEKCSLNRPHTHKEECTCPKPKIFSGHVLGCPRHPSTLKREPHQKLVNRLHNDIIDNANLSAHPIYISPRSWEEELEELLNEYRYGNPAKDSAHLHVLVRSLLSTREKEVREETLAWQEADTAPKTGEHILVNLGKGHFGNCGGKLQDGMAVVHYWPHEGEEGFYLSLGNSNDLVKFEAWMPLPLTPKTEIR